MKKFWENFKFITALFAILILVLVVFVGVVALSSNLEKNVKEQAYAQGQHDILHNCVKYTELAEKTDSDTDQMRKEAYAQGLEDAAKGDVRIRAINDSTYVWTKSPWGEDDPVPTDTLLIKK